MVFFFDFGRTNTGSEDKGTSSRGTHENLVLSLVSLLKEISCGDSLRITSLSGRKGKRVLELKFKGTETSGESSSSVTNSSGGDGGDKLEEGDGESEVVTEKIELVIDTESGRKLLTELLLPKDHV